jgi:hypothetical protein
MDCSKSNPLGLHIANLNQSQTSAHPPFPVLSEPLGPLAARIAGDRGFRPAALHLRPFRPATRSVSRASFFICLSVRTNNNQASIAKQALSICQKCRPSLST